MFRIYLDVNKEIIRENLDVILFPFFSKCYRAEIVNLSIASNLKEKIEILKKSDDPVMANYTFEDYRDLLLITVTRYVDLKTPNKIVGIFIKHEKFIKKFPKSFDSKIQFFIKNRQFSNYLF